MKLSWKVIVVIIFVLTILLITTGLASASGILMQEYWVFDGFSGLNQAGSTWHAQTFVANSTYNVTAIELRYFRMEGASGNASVSIRSTDANGEPTEADLATSNPVNLDSLPDGTPTTVHFDFNSPYLELTNGVKYAIVARIPDANGIFAIGYNNPGGFTSGEAFQSFNSGAGWMWPDELDTFDLLFKIYGEQEAISPGSLQVTKMVDWNGTVPDPSKTFEICITGPAYPGVPSCVDLGDGQSATWFELEPGEYTITETDPGADWQVSGGGQVIAVVSGQTATTTITNTFTRNLSLNIEKATNGEDADTAPGPYIMVGDPVTWTYVITNTGDVPLINISVVDDRGVAVTAPKSELVPGESMTALGYGSAVTGQYQNVGTVTGEWQGFTVSDNDSSHYFGGTPSIEIEKATNGQDADVAPGPYILTGDPIIWTYVVTNTGDVTLTNISVVDDQGVTVTAPKSELVPGESMTATGNGSAVTGQYQNVGTVTGEWQGFTVSDNDPSHYFGKIQIDVKPGSDKNPINLGSKGRTPVAILTADTFDATTVDPETIRCGPGEASPVHHAFEDVDYDGDIDMIVHFNTQELGLTEGTTMIMLSGETNQGVYFEGFDSIEIVPDKDKQDNEDNGNHKENAPGQNKEPGDNPDSKAKGKDDAPGQNKEPGDNADGKAKGKADAPGQNKDSGDSAEGKAKGKDDAPGQI